MALPQCPHVDWMYLRKNFPHDNLPGPDECYELCRGLISGTVWKFWKRHGGDYYELKANANMCWLRGDRAYREAATNGRSIHPNYLVEIRRWIWYELFDEYRTQTQHRRQVKVVIENDEYIGNRCEPEQFNFIDFCDELSADARTALGLLLDVPADCTMLATCPDTGRLRPAGAVLAAVAAAKGGQARNLRSTLRQHLAGLGWGVARINESFDEIREALR